MKKIIYLLTIFIICISCSNNDEKVAGLVADKVATMSGHEVVRDLLIKNDGDEEQLARIFKCSISTIKRVKNKETYLTDNSLREFKNLLVAVNVSGEDTFKENDPYYDSWIRSFLYWLNSIFWIVLVISIFGLMLGAITANTEGGAQGLGLIPLAIYGIIYLLAWILNLIWSYEQPANLFIEKINPILETLL
ncbi:hypothetical protein LNJ05_00675 [Tenacibaculum finnmarkense genomovar ulcerans]|uniref:hypothetical protein n=1 Tax=Tenacibaculum finnmarkense TaxID=2781243 RepID=UPI001E57C3C0|nr:hypothetical protein [Tenacibaculum finnmarkense]MCD8431279.1 hypothetical protein [Tenacibaculum finnmarkense genomovar ulcerans]